MAAHSRISTIATACPRVALLASVNVFPFTALLREVVDSKMAASSMLEDKVVAYKES